MSGSYASGAPHSTPAHDYSTTIAEVREKAARDWAVQEREALLRQTSMRDPAGRGRRDTGRSDYGPPQVNADGWTTPTTPPPPTKAGDLSKFGKIDRSAGLQFGPSSVFSECGEERESASVTRVTTSTHMPSVTGNRFQPIAPPFQPENKRTVAVSLRGPDGKPIDIKAHAAAKKDKGAVKVKKEDGPPLEQPRQSGAIRMETEETKKRRLEEEKREEDLAKVKAKRGAKAAERRRREDEEKERRKREDEERERKKDEEEHREHEGEEENRRAEERLLEDERLEKKEHLEKERSEKRCLKKKRQEKRLEQFRLAKERLAKDNADRKERERLPQRLPSALARARIIEDIDKISYPQGIKAPRRELNVNATSGKFRYDRNFLLQFTSVCKDEPDDLPLLAALGLQPGAQSSLGGRPPRRPPTVSRKMIGIGIVGPGEGPFTSMGVLQGPRPASEDRFAQATRNLGGRSVPFPPQATPSAASVGSGTAASPSQMANIDTSSGTASPIDGPQLPRLIPQPCSIPVREGPPSTAAISDYREEVGAVAPAMTLERAKEKITEDVKEFFMLKDLNEGEYYFESLPPDFRNELIETLFHKAIDAKEWEIQLVIGLFGRAAEKGLATESQFEKGFEGDMEFLEYISVDVPQVYMTVAKLMCAAKLSESAVERLADKIVVKAIKSKDKLLKNYGILA